MATLHRLGLIALGLSLIGATTGCEKCQVSTQDGSETQTQTGYCSVNRFQASNAREASATLGDGRDVTIKSINGKLTVGAASGGDVSATFHAFVYRAFNTADSEIQKDFELLVTDATADADGNVTVSTSRKNGAKNTLGADFDVKVPSTMSGAFTINQNNGAVDVSSVGTATSVSITSDNGSIDASVGSDANTVNVSGDNGDVTLAIGGVPVGATGGSITAQHGDISLTLPSTGGYSVPATAGTKVDFGTPPTGCAVEEAASNSKTLTCNGGGAIFTVNAKASSADVTVKYR